MGVDAAVISNTNIGKVTMNKALAAIW